MNRQQLKILAIDPTPANLARLALALQQEYALRFAATANEGLALAHDDPPDLILLDIMLPEIDGYETFRRIRADPVLRDIPIIIVSAFTENKAEERSLTLGAADYLLKPINIEVARLRIRNLLEREQFRRALKHQEKQLHLAASVFDHVQDGIIICDADVCIIEVNAAFSQITGFSREEVLGQNPRLLKSGLQSLEFYKLMWQVLLSEGHWHGEFWNRHKNGEVFAALTSITVVRDEPGNIHHFIGLFADITQLKNHEYALEHIAHFDPLTGIPNRLLLADRLEQAIAHTLRAGNQMAVCYLDLDGFKPVNDLYGHKVGDQLLIEVAQRIKDCLRAGDTVARVGGDEFVLLLLDFNEAKEFEVVLLRMLSRIAEAIIIQGHRLSVSASLGFTLFPHDLADAETLMFHADQAMYVAKQRGKNRCHLYEQQIECGQSLVLMPPQSR